MSETDACTFARALLGPALLGRVTDAERAGLEAHLAACPACAVDRDELAPVVALLARVDPDALEDPLGSDAQSAPALVPSAPDSLRTSVLSALRREQRSRTRQRRWAVAAPLSAAAVVAAVLLVVGLPGTGPGGAEGTHRLAAVGASKVSGTVQLTAVDGGTEIEVDAVGMTVGRRYGFWLERRDGSRVSAGRWQAYESRCRIRLSADLPLDKAVSIGFTTVDDRQDVAVAPL